MKKRILSSIMMVILVMILVSCGTTSKTKEISKEATTVVIKDMAGRDVTINKKISKVYSSSPVGTLIMYTFDDKKVAGLNFKISEEEKKFTTKHYQSLPNLGGWYGKGKTGNVEEIMKVKPDFVISTGLNKTAIESANKLQKQLGIPVVIINDDIEKIGETYRFIGKILSNEERGNELAQYCETTVKTAKDIASKIPENKKVSVYYAEEISGLNTDPSGSPHSKLIDISGGKNVANVKITPGYGRTEVSMEQVMSWNPSLIIASVDNGYKGSGSYETILKSSSWSKIKAVKDGHVYQTPTAPFNWFDRPPSVNTIIGIKWTQNLLYPEYAKYNMKEETKKFYKLFYHYDLTDKDVNDILQKSVRTK
ncbi:MAG: ABC transporter substrate-binding protein [Clostridium sp.]